jgi:hypothetical protein
VPSNVGRSQIDLQSIEYDNSSVGEEEHFEVRHLVQALVDWQVASLSPALASDLSSSSRSGSTFSSTCQSSDPVRILAPLK